MGSNIQPSQKMGGRASGPDTVSATAAKDGEQTQYLTFMLEQEGVAPVEPMTRPRRGLGIIVGGIDTGHRVGQT